MRWRAIALTVLLLAGCSGHDTPVSAYRHISDQLKAASGGLFGTPCTKFVKEGSSGYYESTPSDDCYRFTPPRRQHGIWVYEFEGSNFVENATQVPPDLFGSQERTWLQDDDRGRSQTAIGRIFLIEFIGRRTKEVGGYGHMGGSKNLVLVDRMISMREIPAPAGSRLAQQARESAR